MSAPTLGRAVWHPVTGAGLVVLVSVLAVGVAAAFGVGTAGLTAFLAMGALAGFSVSGST